MKKTVVYFDGECNLCNHAVQFIIEHQRNNRIGFASLQGAYAQENLHPLIVGKELPDSIIVHHEGEIFAKSKAAFKLASFMKPPYSWLAALRFIPSAIADPVYDFVARNRYKWFGKRDQCVMMRPEYVSQFLDNSIKGSE